MKKMKNIDFAKFFATRTVSVKHGEIVIQELIEDAVNSVPKNKYLCWWNVPALKDRSIFLEVLGKSSELTGKGLETRDAIICAIQFVYDSVIEPVNNFLKGGE